MRCLNALFFSTFSLFVFFFRNQTARMHLYSSQWLEVTRSFFISFTFQQRFQLQLMGGGSV